MNVGRTSAPANGRTIASPLPRVFDREFGGSQAREPELRRRLGQNDREYSERKLAKQPTLERFEATILG
jgi:hypothetical protein